MEKTLEQKRLDRETLIKSTIVSFENYVFPKYIDNYKTYLGFILERINEIESWQSNIDYPLVASIVDTMFASIYDFGFKFNIDDKALRDACSKAFDFRQTGKRTISSVAKEALICGKGYARDFLYKDKSIEKFDSLGIEVDIEIKTPTIEYISVFDVFYDRSTGLSRSPFKIVRTYITGDEIKKKARMLRSKKLIKKTMTEEEVNEEYKKIDGLINKILLTAKDKDQKPFSFYNCNTVKDLSNVSPLLINKMRTESSIGKTYVTLPMRQVDSERDMNNYFLNKENTSYEFVTYNTLDEVAYYVNGVILYEGKKIHNIGEIREIVNSEIPGTGNAQGEPDKIGGLQFILNGLWNAFLDNTKMSLSDMYEVVGNSPFVRNGQIDFKKFRALKVNQPNSIRRLELGTKDFAPLNYMQVMTEFGQQRSGVNQYLLGGQGRAERVAGGVDLILNQYKSKLTPITDSINMMMGNIARSWVLMFLKYFTKTELTKKGINIVEVMDDNSNIISFTVNGKDIKDIIDEDNITFSFDALYKVEQENRRMALKENLQYLLQYAQDKVNLPELMKAVLGMDFSIDNIFKDESFKESFILNKKEITEEPKQDFTGYQDNQNYNNQYKKEEQSYDDDFREPKQNYEDQLTQNDLNELDDII